MSYGLFGIARSALLTHQTALQTISQNIANAETPGYSRQEAVLVANTPVRMPYGNVGTGVHVETIVRKRDLLLDETYHIGDGQDGQHLLEDLRHNAIIPLSTLFVMVTGERQYERVVSAAELAPNDYILKPFAADTLHDRILRALADSVASPVRPPPPPADQAEDLRPAAAATPAGHPAPPAFPRH